MPCQTCYDAAMKIYFSHGSALKYWRSPYGRRTVGNAPMEALPAALAMESLHFDWLDNYGIGAEKVHVSISDARRVTHNSRVAFHVVSGPVPEGFYEHIAGDWWASSPELCFYQMAGGATLPEAVKSGYEFCALYRKSAFAPSGLEYSDPLTNAAKLREFGERYAGRNGSRVARTALQYVADNAASPMEVAAAMLLTLPRAYGGYGLPACLLNPPTEVIGALAGGRRFLHGDLVWPAKRVVVEYESNEFHLTPEEFAMDSARRNTLQASGWTVLTLTWGQMRDERRCDELAAQLAHILGVRHSYEPRGMLVKRAMLRDLVLNRE